LITSRHQRPKLYNGLGCDIEYTLDIITLSNRDTHKCRALTGIFKASLKNELKKFLSGYFILLFLDTSNLTFTVENVNSCGDLLIYMYSWDSEPIK
jgi:hypothetical protein